MRQWNAYADEVAPPVQSFSLTPIRIVEVQKDYVPRDRLPNPIEGRTSNWPKLDASSLKREWFADIVTTTNSREALRVFEERTFDLVLLDLMMPGLDGFALLQAFGRLIPGDVYLPILVLTADATLPKRRRALALGAKDFLTKPFDAIEVILRIFNLLETRVLMLELASDMHGVLMAVIGLPAENNCKAGIAGISALLE